MRLALLTILFFDHFIVNINNNINDDIITLFFNLFYNAKR